MQISPTDSTQKWANIKVATEFMASVYTRLARTTQPKHQRYAKLQNKLIPKSLLLKTDAGSRARGARTQPETLQFIKPHGSFYLIAYFQVLAANRDNPKLIWWSNFTNGFLVVLIVGTIGAGVLAAMQVIPTIASLAILGVAMAVMYFAWMKTLWHALEATRPVARDFEAKEGNNPVTDFR